MDKVNADRRWILPLVAVLVYQLAGCAAQPPRPDPTESTRPRVGQIVDADTGKPLEGALVLDVFYLWPKRGLGDFPVSKVFRDSAETLTDGEGRFRLSGPFDSQSWWTDGLFIFKSGYGPWRFHGQDQSPTQPVGSQWAWLRQIWDQFTTTGVIIELRPLRTQEERMKYVDRGWDSSDVLEAGFSRNTPFGPSYFFDVPADRLTRFQRAVDEERAKLGLAPRRLDRRSQQQ